MNEDLKLSDYFCKEFIEELISAINSDTINYDKLNEHVKNCEICSAGVKKLFTVVYSKISLFDLLKI